MPEAMVDERTATASGPAPDAGRPSAPPQPPQQSGGAGQATAPPTQIGGTTPAPSGVQSPTPAGGAETGRGAKEPLYQTLYQRQKQQFEAEKAAMQRQIEELRRGPSQPTAQPVSQPQAVPQQAVTDDFQAKAIRQAIDSQAASINETEGWAAAVQFTNQQLAKYGLIGGGPQATAQPAAVAQPQAQPVQQQPAQQPNYLTPEQVAEIVRREMQTGEARGVMFNRRLQAAAQDVERVAPGFMQEQITFAANDPMLPETLRGLEVSRAQAIQLFAQSTGVDDPNQILRFIDPAGMDKLAEQRGFMKAQAELSKRAASAPAPGGSMQVDYGASAGPALPAQAARELAGMIKDGGFTRTPPPVGTFTPQR